MSRLSNLSKDVELLYFADALGHDEWIEWGYKNHLLVVVNNAKALALEKGANVEFCEAGAFLHDIADSVMDRSNPEHEEKCLEMARNILSKNGFKEEEIRYIIEKIITPHSCFDVLPTTLDGQVMATADAMAHFQTDFYAYFCWQNWGGGGKDCGYETFKEWVLKKIEKDFNKKIFFSDMKEKIRPEYKALKIVFSK